MFPVLKSENEIISHLRKNIAPASKDFIVFFSSTLKAYITDPMFMTIPLEDKMVHRGYACFETTKIYGNNIYQLDKHIERLLRSTSLINLKSKFSKDEYRNILMKTASLARKMEPKSDIELRFFYSAGLGNMSLVVDENYSTFYAIALKTDYSVRPVKGVEEYFVNIPEIKSNMSASKNTNYLLNGLVIKESRDKGGYYGIMVDENGHCLESPMSNIAFITNNGEFNVPPFEKTLKGTTVLRLFDFVNDKLIPEGLVKGINRDYIKADELVGSVKEAMFSGGDFVIPILKVNGQTISETPGPITKMFQEFLINDKKQDDGGAEELPVDYDF